jgi:hypothetical protein
MQQCNDIFYGRLRKIYLKKYFFLVLLLYLLFYCCLPLWCLHYVRQIHKNFCTNHHTILNFERASSKSSIMNGLYSNFFISSSASFLKIIKVSLVYSKLPNCSNKDIIYLWIVLSADFCFMRSVRYVKDLYIK